ncbi:uncharacterized protein LOC127787492 [Diospyros lotus]|uniref:uncharacterized protein LOC127787492 n=1 Tax=Diospyros lotus TaxID=55363 RepID=UPI0022581AE8|nr:uncharacterized protein LOC127787492 [Diospyros lotus]
MAHGVEGNSGSQLLKNFMALRPPEFSGGIDAVAVERWMKIMEKRLRALSRDLQIKSLPSRTSRGFQQYVFPEWMRAQKVYEFIELTQGNKLVAQYKVEFISLARFVPELVSSKANKAAKFQLGLRAEIRYALAGAWITNYFAVVQRAYAIERDRIEMGMDQATLKGTGSSQGCNNDKKRRWEAGPRRNVLEVPTCKICGKKHKDLCIFAKGGGGCFLCE